MDSYFPDTYNKEGNRVLFRIFENKDVNKIFFMLIYDRLIPYINNICKIQLVFRCMTTLTIIYSNDLYDEYYILIMIMYKF